MATKIEWDIFDYAARDVLSGLLDELGASYREMENLTQGEVTYSRIRDIKMGNKAPVRLSEFIRLSAISHCLPVQALNMVLDRVSELENEEYMSMTQEERDSINEIFEMLKAQQSSDISIRRLLILPRSMVISSVSRKHTRKCHDRRGDHRP